MDDSPYAALATPESPDHFVRAMEAICSEVDVKHFVVARLHGSDLAGVAQIVHNVGVAGDRAFNVPRHWSFERLLDVMRSAGPPLVMGDESMPGMEVAGFSHGVAAIAREEEGACVVCLGLSQPLSEHEQFLELSMAAQLSAQYALAGLEARQPRACPMTRQELACLRRCAAGGAMKDAARDLGLSVRTVEAHLDKARIRCGVDSTIQLAVLALREGWITVESRDVEASG